MALRGAAALPGGGGDTAASGCDGKALLRREGVVAALTPNRHSVHSTCQRGQHFAVLGRFPCRVDAKSAVCAFYVSTRLGAAPVWCQEQRLHGAESDANMEPGAVPAWSREQCLHGARAGPTRGSGDEGERGRRRGGIGGANGGVGELFWKKYLYLYVINH